MTTTISQVIDPRPLSWLQIRTMILCGMVVFVDGYDLQTIGLVIPEISKVWSLPPGDFKYALVASMLGIGVGSAFISPLGDRLGRRPLIILGLLLIGCTSLGTAYATTVDQLILWRALTGAGIGICQSNATALTAEYAPFKRRAGLMTLMGLFVAVGAMVAGMTAAILMKSSGWQALFVVGGGVPLGLALLFAVSAPESVRLLLARHATAATDTRIAKTLSKMAPDVDPNSVVADPAELARTPSIWQTLVDVVRQPYLERTLHLWGLFALTSLLLYTLVNWLPTLLAGAGWKNPSQGMMTMQFGGIFGSLILAWAMDRGHTIGALTCGYSIAGIAALLFMVLPAQGPSWFALAALMGVGISGGMLAVAALGAIFYPPPMRATGFGWVVAAARIGAVMGPLIVGLVLDTGVASDRIIAWLAAPAAICVLIVTSMRGVMKRL